MRTRLTTHALTQYKNLQRRIAEAHETDSSTQSFTVQPTAAQDLNEKITASADFLRRINVIPVTATQGEKVLIGVSGPVSGRTDTNTTDRLVTEFCRLEGKPYELVPTETDVGISFAKIDSWAKFEDFYERYYRAVQKQIALDRIVIGFHGTHAAPFTNLVAFPWLEDVNKGWLQQAREQIPAQVMTGGATPGVIEIGSTGDHANLDALVLAVKRLIAPQYRTAGDLVAIIGSDLLDVESAKLYITQGDNTTEKERIETAQVTTTYGGLPAFNVPFFPANAVLVTSWDNLSIYFQESSWRRFLEENSKRSRVEDYNSRNEGYVIEQLEKIALAENIVHVG